MQLSLHPQEGKLVTAGVLALNGQAAIGDPDGRTRGREWRLRTGEGLTLAFHPRPNCKLDFTTCKTIPTQDYGRAVGNPEVN